MENNGSFSASINWTAVVTAFIAVYGAVLSTITMIRQIKQSKPNLQMSISGPFSKDKKPWPKKITLVITNRGEKEVEISNFGFILPKKNRVEYLRTTWTETHHSYWRTTVEFPYVIKSGRACSAGINARTLVAQLEKKGFLEKVKLIAFCSDSGGNTYRGESKIVHMNLLKEFTTISPDVTEKLQMDEVDP